MSDADFKRILRLGIAVLALYLIAIVCLIIAGTAAHAHDIYTGVRGKGGNNCCDNGDCEPLTEEQIKAQPNGDFQVYTNRLKRWVLVDKSRVEYKLLPMGEQWAGHWCGDKKYRPYIIDGQPDMEVATYCFFLAPPSF